MADRDLHVLQAVHLRVDAGLLEGPQQSEARDLRHPQLRDLAILEADRAAVDRVVADDRVEQRGLAGAVRPDQPGAAAVRPVERDVDVGAHAAERLGDAADLHDVAHSVAYPPPTPGSPDAATPS